MAKAKRSKNSYGVDKGRLETILNFAFVPLLILGLVISIAVYQTKKNGDVPTLFGYSFLTIVSNSMEPELDVGDTIVCKVVPASEIEKGDIISFHQSNAVFTHKVAAVFTREVGGETVIAFQTYGINNKDQNGNHTMDRFSVTEHQLVGKYMGNSAFNGIASFLTGKLGMFFLIIVPLGVIIIIDILSLMSLIGASNSKEAMYALEVKKFNERFSGSPRVSFEAVRSGTLEGKKVFFFEKAEEGAECPPPPEENADKNTEAEE